MFAELFWGMLIVVVTGLGLKLFVDKRRQSSRQYEDYEITWTEFAVTAVLFLFVALPLVNWGFNYAAFQNQVTYEENWSGFEVQAQWEKITCHRDGMCTHCYDCDPYTVKESYECGGYEGSGKDRRYVSKTCYRDVTKYHECPYTDEEWTFVVRTTVGEYTIASHNLPTNPDDHRWRSYVRVPSRYESGVPTFWQQAADRLARNEPAAVTARKDYENYILASEHTIMKQFSGDIDTYKKSGILPALSTSVNAFYFANRVYFVGVPSNGAWVKASNFFNGAFGIEKQGDLHLVIVDSAKVDNPDNYIAALTAYWQGPEFEKNALSKNALVVVLGTKDGTTVDWARGSTGMPAGNEALLLDIRYKLPGTPLSPESILGTPTGTVVQDGGNLSIKINHTAGALESLVWGPNQFKRVGMREYQYLAHEIKPTSGQLAILYIIVLFASIAAWVVCIRCGPDTWHRLRPGNWRR